MKKITVLTMASTASLFLGGAAMAAPIGGYDAWTVSSGTITATCPAGHTCTSLDATGNGILQQRVTDNTDTTVAYFRTIVTDEGATASDLSAVQSLGFRSEGMIGAQDGSGNYINRSIIKAGTQLGNDAMSTMAEIGSGSLMGIAAFTADQEQGLGATTRSMDWHFQEGDTTYLELNHYSTGGVAGGGTGNEGTITVRRAGLLSEGGTLTLDPAGSQEQTLAYAAGNAVTAVWLTQAASGIGSQFDRTLGLQRYTVVTTTGQAQKTNAGGTSVTASNADGNGNFVVDISGGASTEISGTQFGWNAALFGTQPQEYFTNSISSGLLAPPSPGIYTNDYILP
ncbi:MAG: hypothetical protein IT488_08665 [Gammaproteobacteria bacterium]|nr:hypothetical protein [Gammaproteobacteria bacterium]